MAEIVVVGGGGHAKVVISLLNKLKKFKVLGYTDKKDNGKILGVSFLGSDSVLPQIKKKYSKCQAVIGIGTVSISHHRQKVRNNLIKRGFGLPALISPDAVVNQGVIIEQGTVVMDGVVIQTGSIIGECAIINTGALIDHDSHIGDFVHVGPGAKLCGSATVGSNALIGAGSTVIQCKKVCSGCLVGAGSTVIKDCLEPGTYFGVPARLCR